MSSERDALDAEFLLGNALFARILGEMEKDAIDRALNAYSARDFDQAGYAAHEALAVRDLSRRLTNLLKTKAVKRPMT